MEQIIFNQQNHIIVVEPNAYGDLEYKQRVNWSSNNHIQRERANLLFRRVEQTIYNIANDIDTGDVVYTGRNNDYICRISDGIGRILFEIVCCSNNKILIIIKDFIWDYKNSTNTWWNIVEDKTINKQNKVHKTMKQKIRLTESQLHNVIRRCINEALGEIKPKTSLKNYMKMWYDNDDSCQDALRELTDEQWLHSMGWFQVFHEGIGDGVCSPSENIVAVFDEDDLPKFHSYQLYRYNPKSWVSVENDGWDNVYNGDNGDDYDIEPID